MNSSSERDSIVYGVTIPLSARVFLRDQLNLAAQRGARVHLVYGSDGDGPVAGLDNRVTETELPVRRDPALLKDLAGLLSVVRYLRRIRPTTVVMGTPKMGLLGLLAAVLCRVPRRVYVLYGLRLQGASGFGRAFLWLMERLTISCATEVLALSTTNRDEAVAMRLARTEKFLVLRSGSIGGVDLDRFRLPTSTERAAARSRFALPLDVPVVGFLGRMTPDKGLESMADLWEEIAAEFTDAWLLTVGPDEASEIGVEHMVERLKTLPRVRVHGPVSDPENAFAAMDLLLLLTRREGFGMVLIEAAACGVPAVANRVNGTVDAVADGVTGILVTLDDVPAAIAAVRGYLRNPDLRAKHAAAGRARVKAEFSSVDVNEAWCRHLLPQGL